MLRRQFVQCGTGLVAGMAIGGSAGLAHGSTRGDLRFDVARNDSRIGYHVLSFAQDGDRLTVDIDIELRVKIAFVTVYRYEHRNREEWRGGVLQGFKSRTNDNGKRHSVTARRADDTIVIEGTDGRIEGPASLLPTTYWHRNFMQRREWIDTQNGRLVQSSVEPHVLEQIAVADEMMEAKHFKVRGDLDVDLWYADDRWVKLAFGASDGSQIDYRLTKAEAYEFLSYRPGEPTTS